MNFNKEGYVLDTNGYLYDGSFEGLLTCVHEAYYRREDPGFIAEVGRYKEKIQGTLFSMIESPVLVATDPIKAQKVYDSVLDKISTEAMETIYHVYLSEAENFEIMVLRYLRLGFRIGFDLNKNLQDRRVMDMLKIERRVVLEAHRLQGFLRFQEKQGFYYAAYEPDHNITALIAPHFAERLADQDFIIHDKRRGLAAVCRNKEWFMTCLEGSAFPATPGSGSGCLYEDLWKGYFSWASIEERTNLKNQKRQMPKRYWKHLTEID